MGLIDVMAGAGLFRGLDEEELKKIEALCRDDERGPGEMVFKEGDEAEDICIVVDGQVELRFELPGRSGATKTQTVSTILPGKAFGWSALVPPHKMTLSAYAGNRPCGFYRINGKALMQLFEETAADTFTPGGHAAK